MNTFKLVRRSKNDVRVRSMFDEMVLYPSLSNSFVIFTSKIWSPMSINSWDEDNWLIMLYGFFMITSSSFLALVSFLLIRVTMIDETMLINWLAMDGWPKCGLATVCFDAIPLQEVHITCVALNWRRMLFKLSTFWGTLEPWYVC